MLSPSTAAYVQRLRRLRADLVAIRKARCPRAACTRIMTSYATALDLHSVALVDGWAAEASLLAVSPRLLAAGTGHYHAEVPRVVVDACAEFDRLLEALGEPQLSICGDYLL